MDYKQKVIDYFSNQASGNYSTAKKVCNSIDGDEDDTDEEILNAVEEACEDLAAEGKILKKTPKLGTTADASYRKIS